MTVLQNIIDDPTTDPCVRRFLTSTAYRTKHHNDNAMLFATYRGERVRVVSVTKTGRVGITSDIANPSAQRVVRLSDLTNPLPTLYPLREPLRRPRSVGAVLPWVAEQANAYVSDILGPGRSPKLHAARVVAAGMMRAINSKLSGRDIATTLGRHQTTVSNSLAEIGMAGNVVQHDFPHLRAVWRTGPLAVGYGAGEVPPEVTTRLAGLVAVAAGQVEAAAVETLRALAMAESVAIDITDDTDEDAELVEMEGNEEALLCAA